MFRTFPFLLALLLGLGSCAHRDIRVQARPLLATCQSASTPDQQPASPLRWIASPDTDDRAALLSWCRGVGPAVVVSSPKIAPVETATPLAIVSWNTHVGGGDVRDLIRALRAGALTGEPVIHFVLLLQEVFRAGGAVPSPAPADASGADRITAAGPDGQREEIVSVAAAEGLSLFYVPSMRNGMSAADVAEDRGNAILSTLPLSDFQAIELPFERQRRVAIAATVALPPSPSAPPSSSLRVVSAHLDATAGPARLWMFASGLRAEQARALAAAVSGAGDVVVGSDLNTWAEGPREAAVRVLRDEFPDTDHLDAVPTFRLGTRLDYLFFRLTGGWQNDTRVIGSRFGSDHHPLVGVVRAATLLEPPLASWDNAAR